MKAAQVSQGFPRYLHYITPSPRHDLSFLMFGLVFSFCFFSSHLCLPVTLGFTLCLSFQYIFNSPSISLALQLHLSYSIIILFLCLGGLPWRLSVAQLRILRFSPVHRSSREDGKTKKQISCLTLSALVLFFLLSSLHSRPFLIMCAYAFSVSYLIVMTNYSVHQLPTLSYQAARNIQS